MLLTEELNLTSSKLILKGLGNRNRNTQVYIGSYRKVMLERDG
jgi:hypothetical protein